jgi:hypothetical protein
MPDLLILIGTLGGLFLFGPIGFIVGPIVCGLFLTVWDIYGTTFREILPPVTSFHRSDQDSSAIVPQKSSDQIIAVCGNWKCRVALVHQVRR